MEKSELAQKLRLILITDRKASCLPLEQAVQEALHGGVTAVMLREKDLPARDLYGLGISLRQITKTLGALLIVNDRVDIALAIDADGVHLGWQSLPLAAAKRLLGRERVIGVSTHSLEEARAAAEGGAAYITFSPIFHTPSKVGLVEALGTDPLRRVCAEVAVPVVALGGINPSNAPEVLAAGASGIAAIRAILAASSPADAARRMRHGGAAAGERHA